jgi:hypothetical protein
MASVGLPQRSPAVSFLEPSRGEYDYFETYLSICRHAPNVSFEPRPFRRDLLAGATRQPTSRDDSWR